MRSNRKGNKSQLCIEILMLDITSKMPHRVPSAINKARDIVCGFFTDCEKLNVLMIYFIPWSSYNIQQSNPLSNTRCMKNPSLAKACNRSFTASLPMWLVHIPICTQRPYISSTVSHTAPEASVQILWKCPGAMIKACTGQGELSSSQMFQVSPPQCAAAVNESLDVRDFVL